MPERPEQPKDDQANRLADCLYYNNLRVAPARDHSQTGTSDTGSLHTAKADTHKAKGREEAQPTAHPPRHVMKQNTASGCERDEAVTREVVLQELNTLQVGVPGSDEFSHVADRLEDDSPGLRNHICDVVRRIVRETFGAYSREQTRKEK